MRSLVSLILLFAAGCGGDPATMAMPMCGDGHKDVGEQCDDGNLSSGDGCSSICRDERFGDLLVTWAFNTALAGQDDPKVFVQDDCTDFVPPASGQTYVRVRSTSGPSFDASGGCGLYQLSASKLAIGDYAMEATFTWGDDMATAKAVSAPKTFMVTIPGGKTADPAPKVVFDNADFSPAPVGTLFFQTYFGSKTAGACAKASPPVAKQRLTLKNKATGAVVTLKTKAGAALDGSAAADCTWPAGASDAQYVEMLPSDLYTLRVEGLDAAGGTVYCGTYTVVAGAGRTNTAYELVVAAATTCP